MKMLKFSFLVFLFYCNYSNAAVDSFIIKRFRHIVDLIESDNARELSKFVNYPLTRQNPLPNIKDPDDFVSHYHILFDNSFKKLLKQYNDSVIFKSNGVYGLVGDNFAGEIWIDEQGKIMAFNYSSAEEQKAKQSLVEKIKTEMYPTVNSWNENVIVAKSEKLLIRIDRTEKGLRYVCWSNNRTMKDAPDIILYNGIEEAQGTMGGWMWTFKNGDWMYFVDNVELCADAKDCGLFLELSFKGDIKNTVRLKEIK